MKTPKIHNYPEKTKTPRISNPKEKAQLQKVQIQNYLALCTKAEKQGKRVISITLDPNLADYAKNKFNTSAYVQQLIEQDQQKETSSLEQNNEETTLIKQLSEVMAKYGFYKLPKIEDMKTFTAYLDEAGDFNHFKELTPSPELYLFHIIMYSDYIQTDLGREYKPEHKQLLKQARKTPLEKRIPMLWQAIQEALKQTEIAEGMPLIQFIANNLINFNEPYGSPNQAKTDKVTINQLADRAGIPFQQFYTKHVAKIKTILEWNGADIDI